MSRIKPDQVSELLKGRRSVYPTQYTGEPVSNAIIEEMLENANWAPTHRLTEPWRFVVFSGKGIQKLASFQSELYKEIGTANGSFDEFNNSHMFHKFNFILLKTRISSFG